MVLLHALRNASLPIITVAAWSLLVSWEDHYYRAHLSRTRRGNLLLDAIPCTARDYTLIQAIVLVYAAIVLTANLVVDLLYSWLGRGSICLEISIALPVLYGPAVTGGGVPCCRTHPAGLCQKTAPGHARVRLLIILVCLAVSAPLLMPFDPLRTARALQIRQPWDDIHQTGQRFWLGADQLGRDTMTRLVYGARISLFVSLVSVGIGVTLEH